MAKLSIEDLAGDIRGKKVLMRVDFNVPLDSQRVITSDARIKASLPSIKYVIEKGSRLILMSHLGRPKGKKALEFSLNVVAVKLSELLGKPVKFASDCIGDEVKKMADELKDGEVMLLENLRFYKEEEGNDPEFSKKLATLGDIYINDAFGTAHRAHASTEGVCKYIKKCAAGFLMQKELQFLGELLSNPKKPQRQSFLFILNKIFIKKLTTILPNFLIYGTFFFNVL